MTSLPLPGGGTKLYIGGTGPIGSESAWVEVAEMMSLPAVGRDITVISYNSLSTGNTVKLKGTTNDGSTVVSLARIPSDTGQAALIAARDDMINNYNFKITLPDTPATSAGVPTVLTCKGKVFSYTLDAQDPNQVIKSSVKIEFQGGWTEVAAH